MSLIYTPLALEDVLTEKDSQESNFQEIEMEGKKLIVEPVGDYEVKVTKLISSDPNDYLDNRFQPGNIITYLPVMME